MSCYVSFIVLELGCSFSGDLVNMLDWRLGPGGLPFLSVERREEGGLNTHSHSLKYRLDKKS